MGHEDEWVGEEFWVEMLERKLYPPEAIVKEQGTNQLISGIDLRGKRVLDYGCGTGWFGRMAKEMGAEVTGCDISPSILKEAEKHISVIQCDGVNLPFDNESFDVVAAFMVLHVIEDLNKALSEIHRVLRKGGYFLWAVVHPHSEKWDEETGLAYYDKSTYHKVEERLWVYNLADGKRIDKHYVHRPLEHYMNMIAMYFVTKKMHEPVINDNFLSDKRYARIEYLFGESLKI